MRRWSDGRAKAWRRSRSRCSSSTSSGRRRRWRHSCAATTRPMSCGGGRSRCTTDQLAANGGIVVKTTGDGAMSVFKIKHAGRSRSRRRHGGALGRAAADLTASALGSPPVTPPTKTVTGTARPSSSRRRLCDAADSGQVLISATTRTLIGSQGDIRFAERRPMRLKGLPGRTPGLLAVASEGVKLRRHLPRWTRKLPRRRWQWSPVSSPAGPRAGAGRTASNGSDCLCGRGGDMGPTGVRARS